MAKFGSLWRKWAPMENFYQTGSTLKYCNFFISVSFCFDCKIVITPPPLRKKDLLCIQYSIVPTICSVGRQRLISSPKPPLDTMCGPLNK